MELRSLLIVLLFPLSLMALTFPTGFIVKKLAIVTGPTALAVAPDGRVFVCEQTGRVKIIKNGVLLSQPFMTLTVHSVGEHGLVGIAIDPQFTGNHFIYVSYTPTSTTARISRFTAQGDIVAPGSELVLLTISGLTTQFKHVGGGLGFSIPDGKLYISVGDNETKTNAQLLTNLFGKILRINKDGTIPGDNPFYNQTTGNNRAIWAIGLRNPFSFASLNSSPFSTYVNDVGEASAEEIDVLTPGANYGWPLHEGNKNCSVGGTTCPIFAYLHGPGTSAGCAIVGATFYDPAVMQFPSSYKNDYFFADLCNNWIRRRHTSTKTVTVFGSGLRKPVALAVDRVNGTFYYAERATTTTTGAVFKVTH